MEGGIDILRRSICLHPSAVAIDTLDDGEDRDESVCIYA